MVLYLIILDLRMLNLPNLSISIVIYMKKNHKIILFLIILDLRMLNLPNLSIFIVIYMKKNHKIILFTCGSLRDPLYCKRLSVATPAHPLWLGTPWFLEIYTFSKVYTKLQPLRNFFVYFGQFAWTR